MKTAFTPFSLLAFLPLAAPAQKRFNILYIMTDDHTSQMMSCYDKTHVQTPNLDRIARDGVRFVNSFVANSLSGPSRACMITGKHSHKNGFTNNEHGVFDGNQQTMPKLLQQVGYTTCLIGKWHLVSTPTGFDHFEIIPGQGEYYNPTFITMDGKRHNENGYLTNILTDKAIAWLKDQQKTDKPFALFLHEKACHRDWLPELKYLHEYEDVMFKIPENFDDDWEGRKAARHQEMAIGSDVDMTMDYDCKIFNPDKRTRLTGAYMGCIGRLNSRERAEYDMFYDSLSVDFRKRNLSGRALKESTPLVMRMPTKYGKPVAKGDITEMVQNIDYAPTFLDLAGAPIPEDIQGVSLLPLLEGQHPKNWRQSLYYHYYEYPAEHSVRRHYGIRTADGYKLIHFYPCAEEDPSDVIDQWEMYDLNTDPYEMHNIYGKPSKEKLQKRLHKELLKLQKLYDVKESDR